MKERIKQLMDSQHMNQQTFSQYTGISPATLSNVIAGKQNPTLKTIEAIKKKFPTLNLDWLMFGSGEMFPTSHPSTDGSDALTSSPTPSGPVETAIDFEGGPEASTAPPSRPSRMDDVNRTPNIPPKIIIKEVDKKQRKIKEIRVFYDDQTWETFVPQNS